MKNDMSENQQGITGLETAIILIAFVVVAAVFAYTVLSAGLFTSQKSQEAVYQGLEETKSTVELDGSVVISGSNAAESVSAITFSLKLAIVGEPMDFTPRPTTSSSSNVGVIAYMDADQYINDVCWTLTRLGNDDGDNLLEVDEKFQITIPRLLSGTTNQLNPALQRNTEFIVEVKPPRGATLVIERTTPREIDPIMNVH